MAEAAGGHLRRPPRAAVRAAVRACLADLVPGDRALVACSGGPDSLALLAATVAVARELGLLVGTVVVDHGLQADSARIAARVAAQARILGCADVQCRRVQVDLGPGAGGPESAARAARYRALEHAAAEARGPASTTTSRRGTGAGPAGAWRGAEVDEVGGGAVAGGGPGGGTGEPAVVVLLGHTRDDQAETVLLGLARGSGTRSLAGMAPRSGLFRRPLLDLPRAVVAAACAAAAAEDPRLVPWADPHNEDPAFARVRVRRDALPSLEAALGPGIVEALARTARLARADAEALDAWAERIWERARPGLLLPPADPGLPPTHVDPGDVVLLAPVAALSLARDGDHEGAEAALPLPWAIRTRLVRRLLITSGCPAGSLTADHVERVTALLDGPPTRAEVALPGGRRARREADALVVRA